MVDFLLTSVVIFLVLVGWLYVQGLYRRFALRHPELGPFRGEGGCDGSCSCHRGSCSSSESSPKESAVPVELTLPQGDPIPRTGDKQ